MELYGWQSAALEKLRWHQFKGIIEGCTGSGKSVLGMAVFETLGRPPTIFAAPTITIAQQWFQYLLGVGIERKDIGLYGDGHKQENRKYIVGVINSLRGHMFPKHIFAIYDEVHNFGSEENIKFLIANKEIPYKIGFTATLERTDGLDKELKELVGPIVYTYSQDDGIKDKVIKDYRITNVAVDLTPEESILLKEQQKIIDTLFPLFDKNYPLVIRSIGPTSRGKDAAQLMKAFNTRKQILYKASNKIREAIKIISHHVLNGDKIIVFGENIELLSGKNKKGEKTCTGLIDELQKANIPFIEYHGRKKDDLSSFEKGEVKVLVSAKCLDEGFDNKETNIGIILSGNSRSKQFIQRSGRILRTGKKNNCILYQMYVPHTKDYDWLMSRMRGVDSTKIEWK